MDFPVSHKTRCTGQDHGHHRLSFVVRQHNDEALNPNCYASCVGVLQRTNFSNLLMMTITYKAAPNITTQPSSNALLPTVCKQSL